MRKVSTVAEPLAELIRRARQSADEHLPLPTVEELARPMLETIYELRRLQDLSLSLELLVADDGTKDARYVESAWALTHLLEEVAALLEAAVEGCLPASADQVDLSRVTYQLVFSLAGADGVRLELNGSKALSMVRGSSVTP